MYPVVLLIGRLPHVIGIIATLRPDLCIHIKDRASGPEGLVPFVERVVGQELLARPVPIAV